MRGDGGETSGRSAASEAADPSAFRRDERGSPAHDGRVLASRTVVFDSGLVALNDPRVIALHQGFDDLVKVFATPPF